MFRAKGHRCQAFGLQRIWPPSGKRILWPFSSPLSDEAVENGIGTSHGTTGGPSRLLWVLSGVCALAIVGSFAYLYKDALDGYHEVLPVYVFSGTVVAGTLVWSYLAAKLSR